MDSGLVKPLQMHHSRHLARSLLKGEQLLLEGNSMFNTPLSGPARSASKLDRAIVISILAMALMNILVLSPQLRPAAPLAQAQQALQAQQA
jgi:hypothetical protein